MRGEVIRESSAEKIICCCSLRLEKNSEPLAWPKVSCLGSWEAEIMFSLHNEFVVKLSFGMDLTMSGLSLILEVSSQRGLKQLKELIA